MSIKKVRKSNRKENQPDQPSENDFLLRTRMLLCFPAGMFCFSYFAVCVLYAGFGLSWLFIWPLGGIFCFARAYILLHRIKGDLKWHCPNILRISYYVFFAAFLISFLLVEGKVIGCMNAETESNLPYVIILGAGVRGNLPTRPLLLRMKKASEYLQENPSTIAIASGGQGKGENISEAACIKEFLMGNGVEESRIIIEDRSSSTEENIQNSFALIGTGAERVGILSNGFHLYRAQKIARMQGHENVTGIAAKTLYPLGIHYTVREYFAIMKLEIKNIIS